MSYAYKLTRTGRLVGKLSSFGKLSTPIRFVSMSNIDALREDFGVIASDLNRVVERNRVAIEKTQKTKN